MWVSKRKWEALAERITDLEVEIQGQRMKNEITFEFCRSVANKEKLSLLSYQQLYSPSADSNEKILMLLKGVNEFDYFFPMKSRFYMCLNWFIKHGQKDKVLRKMEEEWPEIKWWMWIPQSVISAIVIIISLMQLLK